MELVLLGQAEYAIGQGLFMEGVGYNSRKVAF